MRVRISISKMSCSDVGISHMPIDAVSIQRLTAIVMLGASLRWRVWKDLGIGFDPMI